MKVNEFNYNALCDLGASISVMPKKLCDILEPSSLDVFMLNNSMQKPLGDS